MKLVVSYAREDIKKRDYLTPLERQLRTSPGTPEVFVDRKSLGPGQEWLRDLQSAISGADALVALVSTRWLDSDWCQKEFWIALRQGVPIIPVQLHAVTDFSRQGIAKFQAVGEGPLVRKNRVPTEEEYAAISSQILAAANPNASKTLASLAVPRLRVVDLLSSAGQDPSDPFIASLATTSADGQIDLGVVERALRQNHYDWLKAVGDVGLMDDECARARAALTIGSAILDLKLPFDELRPHLLAARIDRMSGVTSRGLECGTGCWDRLMDAVFGLVDGAGSNWMTSVSAVLHDLLQRLPHLADDRRLASYCECRRPERGPAVLRVSVDVSEGESFVAGVDWVAGPGSQIQALAVDPRSFRSIEKCVAVTAERALIEMQVPDSRKVVLQVAVDDETAIAGLPFAPKSGPLRERFLAVTVWPRRRGALAAGRPPPPGGGLARPNYRDARHPGILVAIVEQEDLGDLEKQPRVGALVSKKYAADVRRRHEGLYLSWLESDSPHNWDALFSDGTTTVELLLSELNALHAKERPVQLLWTDSRYHAGPTSNAVSPDAYATV